MNKKVIAMVAASAICGFLLVFFGSSKKTSIINSKMRDAYNATCKIKARYGTGSGVLLNTGYILTAKHCVDDNGDGRISASERTVKIQFYGDTASITTAVVVAVGDKSDFALLKPEEAMPSKITLSKITPDIGEKVFTIGMMSADNPHITSGFVSTPGMNGYPRISCYISFGNSGGGLFNSQDSVVGIVNMIRMQQIIGRCQLMIPMDGYWIMSEGPTRHMDQLNGMGYYVPIDAIREELQKKHLLELIDGPTPKPIVGPWGVGVITTILYILGMVILVWTGRRYLFG